MRTFFMDYVQEECLDVQEYTVMLETCIHEREVSLDTPVLKRQEMWEKIKWGEKKKYSLFQVC